MMARWLKTPSPVDFADERGVLVNDKVARHSSDTMRDLSTFGLLGQQYLDTRHSPEFLDRLEDELERRGIVGLRRLGLEYLAASALWWNIIWWEWAGLDGSDVWLGWLQNLVIFAAAGTMTGFWLGPRAAAATVALIHLGTAWLGFGIRQGTAPDP